MKLLKMLVSTATACLLLGAAGAAMAQEEPAPVVDTCESGAIILKVVDEIVVTDRSCFISDVLVSGNVTATGGQTVTISGSRINGNVSVTGGQNATVLGTQVLDGDILVEGNTNAIVSANRVESVAQQVGGNILVNGNQEAKVNRNIADADITCTTNVDLNSFFNVAGGTSACP